MISMISKDAALIITYYQEMSKLISSVISTYLNISITALIFALKKNVTLTNKNMYNI